jgi:hypothetical protein
MHPRSLLRSLQLFYRFRICSTSSESGLEAPVRELAQHLRLEGGASKALIGGRGQRAESLMITHPPTIDVGFETSDDEPAPQNC